MGKMDLKWADTLVCAPPMVQGHVPKSYILTHLCFTFAPKTARTRGIWGVSMRQS